MYYNVLYIFIYTCAIIEQYALTTTTPLPTLKEQSYIGTVF